MPRQKYGKIGTEFLPLNAPGVLPLVCVEMSHEGVELYIGNTCYGPVSTAADVLFLVHIYCPGRSDIDTIKRMLKAYVSED